MTLFSLRGSTALLLLSLALPSGILAQAPEPAPAPVIAPAAPPAPTAEWTAVSRFGMLLPVPPGAVVIDDRNTDRDQEFNISTMGEGRVGTRAGLRRLLPQDLAEFPGEPGSPEYLAYLGGIGRMPIEDSGVVMRLGGREFRLYRGTGTLDDDGVERDTRMLLLIAAEPDEAGTGLLIGVFSAGLGAEVAAQIELDFVNRLAADEPAAPEAEVAVVEDPFALLAAALGEPAGTIPESWERIDGFGYAFGIPGGAALERMASAERQEFGAGLRDREAHTEVSTVISRADAARLAELGIVPGSDDVTTALAAIARVPVQATDRRVMLGGQPLRLYLAVGTRALLGSHHGFFLLAEAPDAEGRITMIAAAQRGFEPEAARQGLAAMMASLSAGTEPPATGEDAFDLLAAALSEPAGTQPEGWERVEGFGYGVSLPPNPGLSVDRDPNRQEFEAGFTDREARTEASVAVVRADAQRLAQLRIVPGSDDVVATLERREGVSVRASDRRVMLGDQAMRLYLVAGERPRRGASLGFALVAEEPDAEGRTTIVLASFRGFEPEAARDSLAAVMASLAVSVAQAEEAPVPDAVPEAAVDTPPAALALIEGLVVLQPGAGYGVRSFAPNAVASEAYLGHESTPDEPRLRVVAGGLSRPLERQVSRLLAEVQTLAEADLGGLPVWIVTGFAARNLQDQTVGAEAGVPALLVAPRLCVGGQVPYMVALMAAPGQEADLDAALAGLSLQAPEGAEPCPGAADGVRALLPAAPPPALPEGWEGQERFGIRFALPAGMRVRRERATADQMEYWLQQQDAQGDVRLEMSLRVLTPEARAGMEAGEPGTPEFAAMLSRFAGIEVARSEETARLGDVVLHYYRGRGTRERQGAQVPVQMLYLIAETPAPDGLSPWLALMSIGEEPAAAQATEAAFVGSLGGAAVAVEAPAAPVETPPVATPPVATPPVATPPVVMPPVVAEPPVATPPASIASAESQAWEQALQNGSTDAVLRYLASYPRGLNSGAARRLLRERGVVPPDERRPEPAPAVVAAPDPDAQAWATALARGTAAAFWTYLKAQPQGAHVGEALARLQSRPEPEARAVAPVPQPAPQPVPIAPPSGK